MRSLVLTLLMLTGLLACKNEEEKPDPTIRIPVDSSTRVRTERDLNPYATVDISPMDMSYFPVEYPKLKMSKATTEPPVARVVYSRPHLGGRTLFKDILHYDSTWRLGANEATEIEFYRDVRIHGKPVSKGRYTLYCTPGQTSWKIVLNANTDTWGLEQDRSLDVESFVIPVSSASRNIEYFTIVFEKSVGGANLLMAWDGVEARLPIEF